MNLERLKKHIRGKELVYGRAKAIYRARMLLGTYIADAKAYGQSKARQDKIKFLQSYVGVEA